MLTTTMESRIHATQIKVLQEIKGAIRRDRMRDVQIRRDRDVRITLEGDKVKLRWFGHAKWMAEERHARNYMRGIQREKHPRGKTKKRWMHEGRGRKVSQEVYKHLRRW